MRDLLSVLDVDRVTVVGHSFGGEIAMQFASGPARPGPLASAAPRPAVGGDGRVGTLDPELSAAPDPLRGAQAAGSLTT